MATTSQPRGHAPPAVRPPSAPIVLDDQDAGAGFENPRLGEQLTPFLRIVETNSKQVKPARAEYVPDARPGMLINTATNEVYERVEFAAVYRDSHYAEWTPVDDGGGFHGVKPEDDPEVRALLRQHGRFKALPTPRGTELVQTFQLYVLYGAELTPETDPGALGRAIVSFSSTKIPVYQRWFMLADRIRYPNREGKLIQPALWQHAYSLATIPVSKGSYDWYNYLIGLARGNDPAASFLPHGCGAFEAAVAFREQIVAGGVKVDYSQMESSGREPGEDDEPPM